MSTIVNNYWIYTTVLIKNEWNGTGTGFIVSDKENRKIYLVTNKHVINKDELKRKAASKFVFSLNSKINDGTVKVKEIKLEFVEPKNEVREHPDKNVDVIVFDITEVFRTGPGIEAQAIRLNNFCDVSTIEQLDIKVADEVMVFGYPQLYGLKHEQSNFPIVRQGIIASRIQENLKDRGIRGNEEERTLRGFLIDGAIIPGSSGSPVILKPTLGRYIRNEYLVDKFPPVLLGIVSEYRIGVINQENSPDHLSFVNLGLVFRAETIRETIKLFN
jgi:S1-C subfamily serine protease